MPIRYGQCWEDADVLLDGLEIGSGDVCLSVASGGDNTLAMLARDPARIVAIDTSAAQLACLSFRIGAYRGLEHAEVLELLGSRPSGRRLALYGKMRGGLDADARAFWDARREDIERGVAGAGKLERYFELFRRRVLPMVHSRERVAALLHTRPAAEREVFYREGWDSARWRFMFRVFFSRPVMSALGRQRDAFRYVRGGVANTMMERLRRPLTALDPSRNPYLHWILTGTHGTILPFALRAENFEAIRSRLDRIELRQTSVQEYTGAPCGTFHRFNLSNIFEYMSLSEYAATLDRLLSASVGGARMVYWNLLVPRTRPERLAHRLVPQSAVARALKAQDKVFFYDSLIVDEVLT